MTHEEFEREMQLAFRRRADFDARFQARTKAIRARQAEFDAGMVEMRELLRQMAENEARMENPVRHIRERRSEEG